MKDFTAGDTIKLKATFKDDGVLFDPDTTSGKVYDKDGNELATFASLTKDSVGQYHTYWQTTGSTPKGTTSFQASGVYAGFTFTTKAQLFVIK